MRSFRFSIRRLLILVAVIALVLYVLIVRPPRQARAFAERMRAAASEDPAAASKKWFQGGRTTNETTFEYELLPQDWWQLVTGKQIVEVRLATPTSSTASLVEVRTYTATPTGIRELHGPVMRARSSR